MHSETSKLLPKMILERMMEAKALLQSELQINRLLLIKNEEKKKEIDLIKEDIAEL